MMPTHKFGESTILLVSCFLQFSSVANINQNGEKRKRVKRGALGKAPMRHPQLFLANTPFSQGRVVFFASKKPLLFCLFVLFGGWFKFFRFFRTHDNRVLRYFVCIFRFSGEFFAVRFRREL